MEEVINFAKSRNYVFTNKYMQYIELYLNKQDIELKYNPKIQNFEYGNSLELNYISNHFNIGSRKNLIFKKFHEDMFMKLQLPMLENFEYMDGYGMIEHSNIPNNDEFYSIQLEYLNMLNHLGLFNK
jgi:hypothetical protein